MNVEEKPEKQPGCFQQQEDFFNVFQKLVLVLQGYVEPDRKHELPGAGGLGLASCVLVSSAAERQRFPILAGNSSAVFGLLTCVAITEILNQLETEISQTLTLPETDSVMKSFYFFCNLTVYPHLLLDSHEQHPQHLCMVHCH